MAVIRPLAYHRAHAEHIVMHGQARVATGCSPLDPCCRSGSMARPRARPRAPAYRHKTTMLCMSAWQSAIRADPHLVVGGQHAHVERHGTHHRGPRAAEQPHGALLLHDADLRSGAAAHSAPHEQHRGGASPRLAWLVCCTGKTHSTSGWNSRTARCTAVLLPTAVSVADVFITDAAAQNKAQNRALKWMRLCRQRLPSAR